MKRWIASVATVTLVVAGGCGKPEAPKAQTTTNESGPIWIQTGEHSTLKPGDVAGVGISDGKVTKNKSLRLTNAMTDAKAKISATLRERVSALVKSYQSSVSDLNKEPLEEAQVSNVARTFTDNTISGARQRDSWEDKTDGTLYVLVVLPFDQMADSLKKKMDEAVASRIKTNSAKAHEELDKAIEDVQKNGWPK